MTGNDTFTPLENTIHNAAPTILPINGSGFGVTALIGFLALTCYMVARG